VFLQGSYANGTAVKPVEGGEYDVDIICISAADDDSAPGAIQDLYDTLNGPVPRELVHFSRELTVVSACALYVFSRGFW
jgi:hypothetical protein